MRYLILCLLSSIFFFISSAFAGEVPSLVLDEGTTTVTLSLVNQSNSDLSSVTATIDRTKLPSWLSVRQTLQTVNVPKGANGKDKLFLQFTITESQAGAEAIVPISLHDSYGNAWNSPVRILASNSPLQNMLYENYPNPFNPSTTIRYSLKENLKTSLVIYNSLGQKIRTLVDTPQAPGIHTQIWNGKNDRGQQVSSGVYFIKLSAGEFSQTRRMMILE
jgi:hypothetical protein